METATGYWIKASEFSPPCQSLKLLGDEKVTSVTLA
jgi:hypothetical protein